jgi:hypothetical protein
MEISGAAQKRKEGHYAKMVEQGFDSAFRNQIELVRFTAL